MRHPRRGGLRNPLRWLSRRIVCRRHAARRAPPRRRRRAPRRARCRWQRFALHRQVGRSGLAAACVLAFFVYTPQVVWCGDVPQAAECVKCDRAPEQLKGAAEMAATRKSGVAGPLSEVEGGVPGGGCSDRPLLSLPAGRGCGRGPLVALSGTAWRSSVSNNKDAPLSCGGGCHNAGKKRTIETTEYRDKGALGL